jgi:hypothetical protein
MGTKEMSAKDRAGSTEPAETEKTTDLTKGITRFAQYTSPVMLAMLASAGKDAAFAQATAA